MENQVVFNFVVAISAWTRGQEKIESIKAGKEENA